MVRKLAMAVSIALGTLSVPAHALGLGELSSKTTLNQNFNGDIALLSVNPDEIDTIRVKLADAAAFSRAGVERPFYLSLLKFDPTLSGKGKAVIRVTSEFPIREPFLNFLVEVNWPNGRLLREYTVLLDPPTTTLRRPPRVAPAAKVTKPVVSPAKPEPKALPQPKPKAKTAPAVVPAVAAQPDATEYGPVKANDTAWSIAKRLRPRGVSMEQMMIALLNANPEAFVDGNINRLRRGRILRVPPMAEIQDLSRQQARNAYRQQQDEWLARRDAKLQKAAAVVAQEAAPATSVAPQSSDQLRIATARPEGEGEAGAGDDDASLPTASDLKSRLIVARENAETSRQETEVLRSEVDDLQQRLRDMQKLLSLKDDQLARLQDQVITGDAAEAASEAAAAEIAVADGAVEMMPGEQAKVDDVQLANQVSLPPAADEPASVIEQAIVDAGSTAGQASEAVQQASDQMTPSFVPPEGYQIPDIEPQIDPDRIVDGKVDGVLGEPGAYSIADIPPQIDPDKIVEQASAMATEAADAAQETANEIMIDVEAPDGMPVADAVMTPVETPEAAAEPGATQAESPPEPQTEAPVSAAASPEPDARPQIVPPAIARMVEQNIVPIAAGGIALLGLIGWLFTRGRRKSEDDGEVLLAGAAAGIPDGAEAPGVDAPAVGSDTLSDLPDSAFLDEFSPGDVNSLQDETGEVDPVSEADVYIAYGRYQQAEELLGQAMSRDPDRLALKHKLLEVHYATRNADAFTGLAREMVESGQDTADEAAWMRAQDMGRELVPANPLFATEEGEGGLNLAGLGGAAATAAAAASADESVDDDTLSLNDLDLSDLDEEYVADKGGDDQLDAASEVSITLDLDDSLEAVDPTLNAGTGLSDLPETLSLDDVSSLEFELPEAEAGDAAAESASAVDTITDSLDLDSMMAEAEAAIDAEDAASGLDSEFSADELQAQLDELSDLSVLDSDLDSKPVETPAEPPASLGLVEEDLTLNLDEGGLDEPLNLDTAFDAAGEDDQENEVFELDAGPGDVPGGEDDVGTKLDLARAYVDMGDEDGARSILEEVIAEGSDAQKGDAQKLMAELG